MPAAHRSPLSNEAIEPVEIATRVHGKAGARVGEVDIYSEIGFWGVTAGGFKAAVKGLGAVDTLIVNVNSPGGDVFDGIAIYNDLIAHPADVIVRVTGLAASAASLIAMAGDRVEMGDNAFLMIHNAWTLAMGDHRDMQHVAETLERINFKLVQTYAKRSGQDADEIRDMMDNETWLDSGDAVELGLADAVFDASEIDVSASVDISRFHNAPAALTKRLSRTVAEPARKEPVEQHGYDFAAVLERMRLLTETMA